MSKIAAIAAGTTVVALIGGAYLFTLVDRDADAFAQCRASQVAGGDIGGPFTLVNGDGVTVTSEEVIDQPSLIYFGYTFCPDVCPLDVARNTVAIEILEEDRGMMVQPVFISIDPERDDVQTVSDYAANFHERMVGLTGSPEQVKSASTAYRTYYRKQEGDDPDYYLMDHSTFSYLMFPDVGFVEFFRNDIGPEKMADQMACFVEAAA